MLFSILLSKKLIQYFILKNSNAGTMKMNYYLLPKPCLKKILIRFELLLFYACQKTISNKKDKLSYLYTIFSILFICIAIKKLIQYFILKNSNARTMRMDYYLLPKPCLKKILIRFDILLFYACQKTISNKK